ncbi:hypothetical protein K3495_g4180 [Podosphaera aphanis]|nr:hypothetical protein K3495_g4180 [Podosphaera aphanis]
MAEIKKLSIPSEGIFESFAELFSACQQHAKMAGYAFSVSKSEKRCGRFIKHINCKHYGEVPTKRPGDVSPRKRLRSSFKTGCKVSLKAREKSDGSWTLAHRAHENCVHNHTANPSSAYPEHRKLNQQNTKEAQELISAGIEVKQIALILQRKDASLLVSHRDLYNIKASTIREQRLCLSLSEALIQQL